jgi:hypothetical protein
MSGNTPYCPEADPGLVQQVVRNCLEVRSVFSVLMHRSPDTKPMGIREPSHSRSMANWYVERSALAGFSIELRNY